MDAIDILRLPRSRVRYLLCRLRTEAEGGAAAPTESAGLREFFAAQLGSLDWRGFGRSWDLAEEGRHNRIVLRATTEDEDWNAILMEKAIVIGGKDEGTV